MMKTDLSYRQDAFGCRVLPNTPAGERAWAELIEQTGSDYVAFYHWPQCKAALKAAGYSIRKARKQSAINDDKLLAELGF